jgi:hypothetical protein
MKKIYTLIAATAIVFSASAQRSMDNQHKLDGFSPKIQPTVNTGSRTAGDTLYYFDGEGFYGLGIDGTFNYALDDLDGLTVWTAGQPYFGVTDAFTFFYELMPTPGDTNIYMSATSYFTPAGTADNWFEVGPIAIPAGGAVYTWGHNIPDVNYRDGYEVLVSTTGLSNVTDFTDPAVFSVSDNDPTTALDTAGYPNTVWYPRSVNLSAYAGQSIYLAIHHNANDMFIINWDNFLVTEAGASGVGISEYVNGVRMGQNSPNPFGSFTNVNYMLENNSTVSMNVYDVTGKKVASQNEGMQTAGAHVIKFNADNLSAGVYYYALTVNGTATSTMKMVVVK